MIVPYNVDVPMDRVPIANWILIGVTCLVSMMGWANEDMLEHWILWRGERFGVAQLVTHQLLHADPVHLFGNMIMLFVFGNAVNARLGHIVYVLAYVFCGVCAALLWLAVGEGSASLGASGAIMGVIGAFLVYYPRNDVSVFLWIFRAAAFQVSAYVIIAVYIFLDLFAFAAGSGDGVAHAAHLGGAAAGFGLGSAFVLSGWIKPGAGERSIFQMIKEGANEKEEVRWVERPLSREPVARLPEELRGGRPGTKGAAKPGKGPEAPAMPKAPPGGWR